MSDRGTRKQENGRRKLKEGRSVDRLGRRRRNKSTVVHGNFRHVVQAIGDEERQRRLDPVHLSVTVQQHLLLQVEAIGLESPRGDGEVKIQEKKQLQFQLVELPFGHPSHPRVERIVVMPDPSITSSQIKLAEFNYNQITRY